MRRQDLGMFAVMLGGIILTCIGTGTGLKPFVAAGSLITGACAAFGMARTHRSGVIRTNRGVTRRDEDPVGFWLESGFWWTVILLWTLGGVLHGLGRLVN